jgi:hypothetical protein
VVSAELILNDDTSPQEKEKEEENTIQARKLTPVMAVVQMRVCAEAKEEGKKKKKSRRRLWASERWCGSCYCRLNMNQYMS